jgi:hypothetical protein
VVGDRIRNRMMSSRCWVSSLLVAEKLSRSWRLPRRVESKVQRCQKCGQESQR